MVTPIAKFTVTKEQRAWVDKKAKKTGESQATIMRNLIQDQMKKGVRR